MEVPRIGLVGLGKMGRTIVHHIVRTNRELVAVAEINLTRGSDVLGEAGVKFGIADTIEKAKKIHERGEIVLTAEAELLFQMEEVNVIIDATGDIRTGSLVALMGIQSRKNIVMLNAEFDALVGPLVTSLSRSAGIVYTGDLGDEPGTVMHYLYEPLRQIGMDVIVAGKGKNNPLDHRATPETLAQTSAKQNLSPKILTSFVDGTKTMVEMTILSNATGLLPDVRGMHGPVATLSEISQIFRLKNDGGILNSLHVVDYVQGIAPGVFAVATTDDEVILENMKYLKVGEGPYFVFYRPYHLPGSETLLTAVKAVTEKKPIIQASGYFSDTCAVAKRDLQVGEKLDGIGGFTAYGTIEKREISKEQGLLPIGLSKGAVVKRTIRRDQPISFDDVEVEEDLTYDLWRIQQKILR
ncbi:MAG: SAF domain-containing protein [Candidatus Caldarchaeum sp.]|nr:SAF domain-containing protein [Candidatus Caldarchaeum sp.]